MVRFSQILKPIGDQRGVTILVVVIMLVVLIGFTALAIDIGHLYVVRNELQNAADAGALAGAQALYNNNGTSVNCGANKIGYEAAIANKSEKVPVDVNWIVADCDMTDQTGQEIQRGHWTFANKTFTPNPSLVALDIWNYSTEQLDANTDHINAVRVVARRSNTPAASFFARIFGIQRFFLAAEAVGYIGFTGSLNPKDVDLPLAVCQQAILNFPNSQLGCTVGRMINSGQNTTTHNTGGWTNYSQEPCNTASGSEMRNLICTRDPNTGSCTCEGSNPDPLIFGIGMGATGGEQEGPSFDSLRNCWTNAKNDEIPGPDGEPDGIRDTPIDTDGDGIPDKAWEVVLPVIDCPGNNVSNCPELIGVVGLRILWLTGKGTDPSFLEVPLSMAGEEWHCSHWYLGVNARDLTEAQRRDCWNEFVGRFSLQDVDGNAAAYNNKSIYFLPSCEPEDLRGKTGGKNFGVRAKFPVLVN